MSLFTGIIVVAFLVVTLPSARAESFEFQLDGGRRAVVALDRGSQGSREWIVFLPGSGCGILAPKDSTWLQALKSNRDMNVLVINKTGVNFDESCREDEFRRSEIRQQRLADIRQVMKALVPADAKVLLIGHSEGGYIAPDIAVQDARVRSMVLLASGTRSWLEEFVMYALPSERPALWTFFRREVIGNLSFDGVFDEIPYAKLNSFHTRETFTALRKLNIPILVLQGDQDSVIWVEGVKRDVKRLIQRLGKTNISMHIIAGADHSLSCEPPCDPYRMDRQVCELLLAHARK